MNRVMLIVVLIFVSSLYSQDLQQEHPIPQPPKALVLPEGTPAEVARQFMSFRTEPLPTREEIDKRFAERSVYKGTVLKLDTEHDRNLFLDIAIAFLEQNPSPKERTDHFSFQSSFHDLVIVGWNGSVKKIERKTGDIYEILMDVRPMMEAREGGVVFTPGFTTEIWEWDGKKLRLKKIEATKSEMIFID